MTAVEPGVRMTETSGHGACGAGDWREQCQWAGCTLLAVAHNGGWWHCEPHLAEHRQLLRGERAARRPQTVIPDWRDRVTDLHAKGLTDRQIAAAMPCAADTARHWRRQLGLRSNSANRAVLPCGTHAAYQRHRQHHQQPCAACRVGERDYQAERHQRRARERAAA